ncbi:ABC transporter permease [Nonomuraea candida]|uniref:ABC transporter permease n=1 Tax=Nonomuraea candida TaxID=359159 RepID=UPI0006949DD5|nr:ABC transporter permease [Nonomuraea candida]
MTNGFRNVVSAELVKLRTLPAALITIVTTVLGAALLAVVLAAGRERLGGSPSAVEAALGVVEYAQFGFVLLGILAAASEYGGGQIRTTLAAVPGRGLLMAGKAIACTVTMSLTALLTIGVCLLAARLTPGMSWSGGHAGGPAGAWAYLTLIGLLGHAVAALLRDLIAALVTMLALVLVVPPVLAGLTTSAGYLPSLAGMRMYALGPAPQDGLTPVQGAAVLTGWLVLALAAALVSFLRRDA